jgi:hypothetical protein
MIYCGSGSDFRKVSVLDLVLVLVPVLDPDNTVPNLAKFTNKIKFEQNLAFSMSESRPLTLDFLTFYVPETNIISLRNWC